MKDRVQEVWNEQKSGGKFIINVGVGQGTVLGPTLFKIFIMDMYLCSELFSMRFADDSNFVGQGDDREETEILINTELKKVYILDSAKTSSHYIQIKVGSLATQKINL